MKMIHSLSAYLALITVLFTSWIPAASADEQPAAPYNKLHLSEQQSQQIQNIEADWKNKYQTLQPQLIGEQQRLTRMLSTPHSDPIDITSSQQHINQIKEQLGGFATATYLKKRRLLNNEQQQGLDGWMKQRIIQRQKS